MATENKTDVAQRVDGSWTHFFRQLLVAYIVWSAFIIGGMSLGSPTVVIPQIRREANSTEALSNEMATWLTSIIGYSGTICVFIIIPTAHFLGRKLTIIILAANTFISSTVLYVSKTAVHYFISQLFSGLTCAALASTHLLLISEYSSPRYRGVFLTIKSATYFWGMWIANAIGIYAHYKYIGIVGMVIAGTSFLVSLIIPESPYWLAFQGRYDECAAAHRWMKGDGVNAEKELDALITSQQNTQKRVKSIKSLRSYFEKYRMAIRQPDIFKPILLCFLVFGMYHFSGKLVCAVYAVEMMKKLTGNQSTAYNGVLIMDGFTVLGMYLGCAMSKVFKRRTLLLTSSIAGTIFLFVMSLYLYLIKLSVFPENSYVIIALLVGYSLVVCCGPVILSSSISAELLPMRFRSFCVSIYSVYCTILLGTIMKVTPYLFNSIGFQGAYLVFGTMSILLIVLIYKYLPETKDKTLYEIADIFKIKDSDEATQLKLLPKNSMPL